MIPEFPLLFSIFGIFKNKIIEIINSLDPSKRYRKANNSICLESILKVLKLGIPWRYIDVPNIHYTTIYKRFIHWSSIGVFEKIWSCFIDLYISKKLKISKTWFKTLFIDTSMIKNQFGIDCKGKNHYDRFRNGTKHSIICDKNNIALSSKFYPSNIHDIKTIEDTLNTVRPMIFNDHRYSHYLIGDKGYIIGQKIKDFILKKFKTKIVTPYRKNQNKTSSRLEKQMIHDRIVIEHVFRYLDMFKRLRIRDDKYIKNFESMNYLAMTIIIFSKI